MSDNFTPKPTSMNYTSRYQSPVSYDQDQTTPPPYRDTNAQKPPSSPPIRTTQAQPRNAPEMYHMDTKRNHLQPGHDDRSFKSSSPLIQNSLPVANARPEVYHLGDGTNRSEPIEHNPSYKPSSPPIQISYPSSGIRPEMYHLTTNHDNSHPPPPPSSRHPSPGIRPTNRVSPMPSEIPDGQHPVVYSIQLRDENHPHTSPANPPPTRTQFNSTVPYEDHHEPGKITMYSLKTESRENHPPSTFRERTPSPPIPAVKKPPVSYAPKTNNTKVEQTPARQNPFPTALQDVSHNVRYVPLSQSKASESIQRSMMKYRFNGY